MFYEMFLHCIINQSPKGGATLFSNDNEETRTEVDLNQEAKAETGFFENMAAKVKAQVNLHPETKTDTGDAAGPQPDQTETPGSEGGEGTAGTEEEKDKGTEAREETLEDVKAQLTAAAALLKVKEGEAEETKNRLLRLQADFDNFRRRNTAEREELATYVTISVVNKFLQILDNFERAEVAAGKAVDVKSVVEGMSGIQKQFIKTLEDLGVKEIPAQGEKFNPNFHEAVMRGQNPELEDDTIDMVFEKGYQLRDKVVRHSKVRVISNE